MRKSFLFYANWCRVVMSFPQTCASSQVIENRAALAADPEQRRAILSGTSRALVERSLPREWYTPDQTRVHFMEHNFYELDPALPVATDIGVSDAPFLEAVSPRMEAVEAVI